CFLFLLLHLLLFFGPPRQNEQANETCRVTGGELFDTIISVGKVEENEARVLVLQMIDAVRYLHDQGIAHRVSIFLSFPSKNDLLFLLIIPSPHVRISRSTPLPSPFIIVLLLSSS